MDIITVAAIAIPTVTAIAIFSGNRIAKKNDEKRKEQGDKLKKHFEEIFRKVITHIYDMSICLKIDNNKLIFGMGAPVTELYTFEEDESYLSFEIHFPERAH